MSFRIFEKSLRFRFLVGVLSVGMPLWATETSEPIHPSPATLTTARPLLASELTENGSASFHRLTWGEAFDNHAPLAFFSVGSLAVGGILIGIRAESQSKLNLSSKSPDRDVVWALGMAGVSSLIAGGAFWYYVRKDMASPREPEWSGLSILPTWNGEMGLAASFSFPLQWF